MNKLLERLRNDFQGNADALITRAQVLAAKLGLEAGEGNERLLRHYVSINVVDKPLREGRDALYGFRHLVQFVAARRLLSEGFSLAQIAKYTTVVPTDDLADYLQNTDRKSEAELLVAAFRSEGAGRSTPQLAASRKAPPPKPLPSLSSGMGMVDVLHEMRDMEQRVRTQLKELQNKMHAMVDDALRGVGAQLPLVKEDPAEFKLAMGQLAEMMGQATERFDRMLQKPMAMIEKQMEQQRYLFEQAHKQKDFLEDMFQKLLHEQRGELRELFERQMQHLEDASHLQKSLLSEVMERMHRLEYATAARLDALAALEARLQAQPGLPPTNPQPKEGAA